MKLLVAGCVVAVTVLISLGMWLYYRRGAPHVISDGLREQRSLATRLGAEQSPWATVDNRLMPHQDVLDLAAAQGYSVVWWGPDPSGRTVYEFRLDVEYPPPCRALLLTPGRGRR